MKDRRKQQPTPVFLPGEFHRQRSLAGTVHGVTESDMTQRLSHTHTRVRKKLSLNKNEFSFFLFKCLLFMVPNPGLLTAWHINSLYSDHH